MNKPTFFNSETGKKNKGKVPSPEDLKFLMDSLRDTLDAAFAARKEREKKEKEKKKKIKAKDQKLKLLPLETPEEPYSLYEDVITLLTRDHPSFFENKKNYNFNLKGEVFSLKTEKDIELYDAAILVKLSRLDKTTKYVNYVEPEEEELSEEHQTIPNFALLRYVRRRTLEPWFRKGSLGGGVWWKRPFNRALYLLLLRHRLYADQPLARIFKKRFRKDIDIFKKRDSLLTNNFFGASRMLSRHRILVKRTLNNVFIHLQDLYNGEVTALNTGGTLGYKGSKKSTNVTAEKVAQATARECLLKGYKRVDVAIESPFVDKFMKTAIQGLLYAREKVTFKNKIKGTYVKKASLSVSNVLFSLVKTHNGVRKPKARRV